MPPTQILLSAGEASGDMYAAQLAAALKSRADCRIFGMGGDRMRAAGVHVITDYSEVSVLGITQIIAWGTIFYSPVLTAPLIMAETGWSLSFIMGGFSLGLLIAGLVAPFVGRSIDQHGGHVVMAAGALVSALGLFGLAHARSPAIDTREARVMVQRRFELAPSRPPRSQHI